MTAAAPGRVLDAVAFTGNGLVVVAGVAFTYYAARNYALDRLEAHRDFWGYLTYVGIALALFGGCGVAEVVGVGGRIVVACRDLALLFGIVFVSFSLREVYYASALAPGPGERAVSLPTLRAIEFGFVVVIAVEWVAVVFVGGGATTGILRGCVAIAFAAYGVVFSERLEGLAHGTAVDTLRRHLVFVLVAATGVAVVDVLALGLPGVAADSARYVFVVLLAGFVVPPTIRLQQSVAGVT
ncbi:MULTISPECIES: hypothetical protein [Halobacterium]|uniref:Uncharacterized protein n=4 Tax=Halobacterium salinarum TaxID=2242 RepID=Q9HR01_HALSA|nr:MULTISPECIES: hypothetical protein [Halobacterium]AAG19358.1 conserved hypothetical protein [Halobacterium salinarum NRC-1]MBB6090471.1 hypothetical protein [Halobacterium salinarum]MCF2166453.1 hypothetical protein [Halobacterium salinarum]MCF2168382.1 hypothetical protein [Halobacterium salinarum]MCF2206695.1 hypothetical protein [Halobacterium salinarum]